MPTNSKVVFLVTAGALLGVQCGLGPAMAQATARQGATPNVKHRSAVNADRLLPADMPIVAISGQEMLRSASDRVGLIADNSQTTTTTSTSTSTSTATSTSTSTSTSTGTSTQTSTSTSSATSAPTASSSPSGTSASKSAKTPVSTAANVWNNNDTLKQKAVQGQLLGHAFRVERGDYNSKSIVLRQGQLQGGRSAQRIAIIFPAPAAMENMKYVVVNWDGRLYLPKEQQPLVFRPPIITRAINSERTPINTGSSGNYQMTLQFFAARNGMLPGYIDLRITNERTSIKGYFFLAKCDDSTSLW